MEAGGLGSFLIQETFISFDSMFLITVTTRVQLGHCPLQGIHLQLRPLHYMVQREAY